MALSIDYRIEASVANGLTKTELEEGLTFIDVIVQSTLAGERDIAPFLDSVSTTIQGKQQAVCVCVCVWFSVVANKKRPTAAVGECGGSVRRLRSLAKTRGAGGGCLDMTTTVWLTAEWPWPYKTLQYQVVHVLRQLVEREEYPKLFDARVSWRGPNPMSIPVEMSLHGLANRMGRTEATTFKLLTLQFLETAMSDTEDDLSLSVDQVLIHRQQVRDEDKDGLPELHLSVSFLGVSASPDQLDFALAIDKALKDDDNAGGGSLLTKFQESNNALLASLQSLNVRVADARESQLAELPQSFEQVRSHKVEYKEHDFVDTTHMAIGMLSLFALVVVVGIAMIVCKRGNNHKNTHHSRISTESE